MVAVWKRINREFKIAFYSHGRAATNIHITFQNVANKHNLIQPHMEKSGFINKEVGFEHNLDEGKAGKESKRSRENEYYLKERLKNGSKRHENLLKINVTKNIRKKFYERLLGIFFSESV